MDRARVRGAAILFSVAASVFVLDRVTKVWAEHRLPGRPIEIVPGVLTFRFATNPGGAFSLGERAPWFFALATLVVAGAIIATSLRHRSLLTAAALGAILGGALGNLTDRVVRGSGLDGHVVDFVDLHVWPIFNIADSAIVIGAILLAVATLRARDPELEPQIDLDSSDPDAPGPTEPDDEAI
jgi:signal peptidase II